MAQKDTNPYKYSDTNKRYMTYDWYMKQRFGGKVAKVSLDIGCSCPNLDGTKGAGGCIYCLNGSSSPVGEGIVEQYRMGREIMSRKWHNVGYIPYFQSNSNTWGDIGRLREAYRSASELEGAVMLDIATRADCLPDEILELLREIAEKLPVTVELGLQSTDDRTAEIINRRHSYSEFLDGYGRLKKLADEVNSRYDSSENGRILPMKRFTVGVHLINGLPGEGYGEMMKSAEDVARLNPDMVKLHLMHVLQGTALGEMYLRGEYAPMSREDYVKIVCDQLEVLPEDTIMGRLTGDGMADVLLAPKWSMRKTEVVNEIDKEMYRRNSWQGKKYSDVR